MKTIISYIPAVHRGYIDFFKKYGKDGQLFILDLSLVHEVPRLERDIRALTADEAQSLIKALGFFSEVKVLSKDNLNELEAAGEIVMPDEDVSRAFADSYLKGKKVEFAQFFLRWDKHSVLKDKNTVLPDRIISNDKFDREMLAKAYKEAKKSPDWWRQIGALAVKDKKILFVAHNRPLPSDFVMDIFGDPRSNFDYGVNFELSKILHAEQGIIAEAARRGTSLEGASLYVTTFPCPMCAKVIARTGIKKIYYKEGYSLLDAEDILKTFGVEIILVREG